jgi:hypothetical protein
MMNVIDVNALSQVTGGLSRKAELQLMTLLQQTLNQLIQLKSQSHVSMPTPAPAPAPASASSKPAAPSAAPSAGQKK